MYRHTWCCALPISNKHIGNQLPQECPCCHNRAMPLNPEEGILVSLCLLLLRTPPDCELHPAPLYEQCQSSGLIETQLAVALYEVEDGHDPLTQRGFPVASLSVHPHQTDVILLDPTVASAEVCVVRSQPRLGFNSGSFGSFFTSSTRVRFESE